MKTLSALAFALLFTVSTLPRLCAAESESGFGLTPSQPETLLPEGQGGLPLIPDNLPSLEKPPGSQTKEVKSKTSAADDALRDRIKLRIAKTKVQSNPEMQALWDSTYKAKTDFEQRAILTEYYIQLCERIGKIDKSINKDELTLMKRRLIGNYAQKKIAPTVPPGGAPVVRLQEETSEE